MHRVSAARSECVLKEPRSVITERRRRPPGSLVPCLPTCSECGPRCCLSGVDLVTTSACDTLLRADRGRGRTVPQTSGAPDCFSSSPPGPLPSSVTSLQTLPTRPILQMREGRSEQVQPPAEGHRAVGGEFVLWSRFCDPPAPCGRELFAGSFTAPQAVLSTE